MNHKRGHSQKGFSLLEILVVLVVVGVIVSGATVAVNFGGLDKELGKTVERFVAYCQYAADTAVFDGEPVGLVLEPPEWRDDPFEQGWRYSWRKLTPQGWVEVEHLEAMELEKEYELMVEIEGEVWAPDEDDMPEVLIPAIVFYPGGDLTFFEIEFRNVALEERAEHVKVNDWGSVVWEEKEKLMEELEKEREKAK